MPSATGSERTDQIRFVAPEGSDEATGADSDPWATLQAAADRAEPGMTIVVMDGAYDGFTMRQSGAAGRPITFMAADGATPVIEEPGRKYQLHVDGVSDVVIDGFEIRGATEQDGAGIFIGPEASRIQVLRSRMRDNRSFGILIEESQDIFIEDNNISGSGSGIRARGDVAGLLIEGNDIHDNNIMVVSDPQPGNDTGAQGVAISRATGPITIRRNQVWGNRAESIDYGTDGSAFEIFAASDVLITENVIWDSETVMETGANQDGECVNIHFVRNVAYGDATWGDSKGVLLRCARDSLIAHNTLLGIDEWVFQFRNRPEAQFGASIENLKVLNNVVSGDVAFYLLDSPPASVVIDYNVVDETTAIARIGGELVTDAADFRARTGFQQSGAHQALGLTDPGERDVRLLPWSPAVDSGVRIEGINDTFSGAAPDAGRYEAGSD